MANRNADSEEDSDVDVVNFENFKGKFEGEQAVKYIDPVNGCHFKYHDLCQRLV